MRLMMFLVGIAAAVFAALIFSAAESAIHEIEALILGVIAAVGFGTAGIMDGQIRASRAQRRDADAIVEHLQLLHTDAKIAEAQRSGSPAATGAAPTAAAGA